MTKENVYFELLEISDAQLKISTKAELSAIGSKAAMSAAIIKFQIDTLLEEGYPEHTVIWMRHQAKKFNKVQRRVSELIASIPSPVLSEDVLEQISKKRELKIALANRDGWICHYCLTAIKGKKVTLDRKIPEAQGGIYSLENCVLSCRDCNTRKGSQSYEEFIQQTQVASGIAC